jgi:hypothetical protein
MTDQIRAGLIALAQSFFPLIVLLGVVDLDDTQIAAIMLFITNSITLAALLFKQGQSA